MKKRIYILPFLLLLAACTAQIAPNPPNPVASISEELDEANRFSAGVILTPVVRRDLFLNTIKQGKAPGNCVACDLSGQDLSKAKFSTQTITDLSGSNLQNTKFPLASRLNPPETELASTSLKSPQSSPFATGVIQDLDGI